MNRSVVLVVFTFLLATIVHAPSKEKEMEGLPSLRWNRFALSLPRALSGDSPHYLVAVNSLVEDGDFNLKNNYDQALRGDWDAGSRFRRVRLDRHVDTDSRGRELGTHSPFFALLLAFFVWPLAGTPWLESLCVWLTCSAGLAAVLLMVRRLRRPGYSISTVILFAGLAGPLLCYSRDVWTEPWIAAIWMALLSTGSQRARFLLGLLGTLLKIPFFVVPATLGAVALLKGKVRAGLMLMASSVLGLLIAAGAAQWMFRDVTDHRAVFHSGIHAGFSFGLKGAAGLLLDPANGLLIFFPVLLWSLRKVWKDPEELWPMVTFFGVHALYADWMGGTGFSSRYLVPLTPILMGSVAWSAFRSGLFRGVAFYSLGFGLLAGFFPALVYDRTPWGIVSHLWTHLVSGQG